MNLHKSTISIESPRPAGPAGEAGHDVDCCDVSSAARYESHYAMPLGRKKGAKLTEQEEANLNKKRSKKTDKKYKERQKDGKVEQGLVDQFLTGE